ncbi:hypothetical protein PYK22_01265 [Pyrinomonas methylaliphatogenes]|uniref:Uncharacterized protein n=1 Tax=Pyrinomonas methylaliphatogenes TaxID=454194 RepID=A0A0B6WWZ2_9BACT|nr:hypothetical protein PYK22_01265 [Pyrinomonas methylaliphatogenes]
MPIYSVIEPDEQGFHWAISEKGISVCGYNGSRLTGKTREEREERRIT